MEVVLDPMAPLGGVLRASASLHTQLSQHCSIVSQAHLHEVMRLSTLVYRDEWIRNPSGSETRVNQKFEWIRNPSGSETQVDQNTSGISLCITRTSITHIPEWPVVRVFICTSGPANHRKCTSWITAKEHVHLMSHATAKEHVNICANVVGR